MNDNEISEIPSLTLPINAIEDRDSTLFSQRVKESRSYYGLTLKALSLMTKVVDPEQKGISTVSLSRYESGAEPGMRELKLLALAFFEPISFFVYGEREDPLSPMERGVVSLDVLFEDMVAESVNLALEKHGIKEPEGRTDLRSRNQHAAMIETVKKLAK